MRRSLGCQYCWLCCSSIIAQEFIEFKLLEDKTSCSAEDGVNDLSKYLLDLNVVVLRLQQTKHSARFLSSEWQLSIGFGQKDTGDSPSVFMSEQPFKMSLTLLQLSGFIQEICYSFGISRNNSACHHLKKELNSSLGGNRIQASPQG